MDHDYGAFLLIREHPRFNRLSAVSKEVIRCIWDQQGMVWPEEIHRQRLQFYDHVLAVLKDEDLPADYDVATKELENQVFGIYIRPRSSFFF